MLHESGTFASVKRLNSMHTLEALDQDLRYGWRMLWKIRDYGRWPCSHSRSASRNHVHLQLIYGVLISPYPYAKANEIWAPEIRTRRIESEERSRHILALRI